MPNPSHGCGDLRRRRIVLSAPPPRWAASPSPESTAITDRRRRAKAEYASDHRARPPPHPARPHHSAVPYPNGHSFICAFMRRLDARAGGRRASDMPRPARRPLSSGLPDCVRSAVYATTRLSSWQGRAPAGRLRSSRGPSLEALRQPARGRLRLDRTRSRPRRLPARSRLVGMVKLFLRHGTELAVRAHPVICDPTGEPT